MIPSRIKIIENLISKINNNESLTVVDCEQLLDVLTNYLEIMLEQKEIGHDSSLFKDKEI